MMYGEWNDEWTRSKQARLAKLFFPRTDPGLSHILTKMTRSNLMTIITMTTGHNDLRYHTSLRDRITDPMCRLCQLQNETFYHLYTFCPRPKELRFKLLGVYALNHLYSWDPDRLLQFVHELPFPIRAPYLLNDYSF